MINLKLAFYAFLVRLAEQSPSFIGIVDCNKGKRLGLILSRHGLLDFKNALAFRKRKGFLISRV